MKYEVGNEMPERNDWFWLRELLDALEPEQVLKLYLLPDELKKTRTACHNWSYRYADKRVVTSTKRGDGGYTLYVRTYEQSNHGRD